MTPQQQKHMEDALLSLAHNAITKYSKGQKEHGGNMWCKSGMLKNLENEVIDFVFYSATIREQLQVALKCLKTNRYKDAEEILGGVLGIPTDK
jgi:hypothetical protein